ncbi:hypothetical protein Tco_0483983 [Tanacetum coccineum]
MKIPIIGKGEYDIWSMRMRQYICHIDHNLWDVIVNGDLEEEPAPTGETSDLPAPKTAKQLAAKRNLERVKSILLLAIPNEYLLKFYNVADAKSLWAAIKARFGGNEESKKMQKNIIKHQFENFTTASNESLDKAYDRIQKTHKSIGVHVLRLEDGTEINMLAERRYPLTKNTLERMMDLRLTVVSDDDTVFDLLSWLVQDHTVPGKDKSNSLIVDSLFKTIRLSIHLVVYNKELAIPEQTAIEGKLKENQGCRVDTDQDHQNGDLKNRSVWIHLPSLQDVYTKET